MEENIKQIRLFRFLMMKRYGNNIPFIRLSKDKLIFVATGTDEERTETFIVTANCPWVI